MKATVLMAILEVAEVNVMEANDGMLLCEHTECSAKMDAGDRMILARDGNGATYLYCERHLAAFC